MKIYLTSLLFFLWCQGVHAQNNMPPAPLYPIPTQKQLDWHKLETYAFIHFGLNTFNDMEWGFGNTPASTFAPKELDCEQWVKTIKSVGFKGVMFTAKHHDGFCLWPSKYTEYSVKNSRWRDGKGDLVKELSESCRKYGLKFGLYLSPWDRNHAQYGSAAYVAYYHNQIEELLTNYGDLFEFWFDGANGGDGWYGGANEKRSINPKSYYGYEAARQRINEKHPSAVIFGGTCADVRWVGNESGYAGMTNWAFVKGPGDEHVNDFTQGEADGDTWLPAECDVSIRPGWFYHAREDCMVHSLSHLVDIYYQSVGRNANLILNFPVDTNGKIHPQDSLRITEWKEVLDADFKTNLADKATVTASNTRGATFAAGMVIDDSWSSYWATQEGVCAATLTFSFRNRQTINRILLQEYIPLGQRISKFSVEWFDGKNWSSVETAEELTTIGYKRIIRFKNVHTTQIRVKFIESRGPICINNIALYNASTLLVEPIIRRGIEGTVSLTAGGDNTNLYYRIENDTPFVPYTKPFVLPRCAQVYAVAEDVESKKRSVIASRRFDIRLLPEQISGVAPDQAQHVVDDDFSTAAPTIGGRNEVVINLDEPQTICGVRYTPDATPWGGGYISRYQVYVDSDLVAEGEFANIFNNPVEQIIEFPSKCGSKVVLKGVSFWRGDTARVSEIALITQSPNHKICK